MAVVKNDEGGGGGGRELTNIETLMYYFWSAELIFEGFRVLATLHAN